MQKRHYSRILSALVRGCIAIALMIPMLVTQAVRTAAAAQRKVFAVAAAFPTVADDVSMASLKAFWGGDANALKTVSNNGAAPTLFITADTLSSVSNVLGAPANPRIKVVDAGALVDQVWAARPASLAIVPFDQMEPRLKLLFLDGQNLYDKAFSNDVYPLGISSGSTNRDLDKMSVVAMTGVTALVRGTAVMMEKKGITYPGEKIKDWLSTADLTHISNEVSFWEKCPKPTFNDGTVMCSDIRYLELLKYVGTDVIDLTGNHLWDKGWENLSTTLKIYEDTGWPYFGGGRTAADALKPAKFTVNGNKIAFVGCNWFGRDWATDKIPGSARCGAKNPKELDLIIPVIKQTVAEGYTVLATLQYYEDYNYVASPQQQKDFAALRDAGAVVVNGSQGHHVQGFDVSAKGFLHYGTGNLFFGDQAGVGTHQTFVDRHVIYNGKYLGVDLRSAFIKDFSQPVPMSPKDRAALLKKLFESSGY